MFQLFHGNICSGQHMNGKEKAKNTKSVFTVPQAIHDTLNFTCPLTSIRMDAQMQLIGMHDGGVTGY